MEAQLRVPEEVVKVLGENPEREALEAMLLYLIREERVSVAWAGERLGMDRWQAIEWYNAHGYHYPDYTEEALEEDLRHAERVVGKSGK